jgi:hypothetical protein
MLLCRRKPAFRAPETVNIALSCSAFAATALLLRHCGLGARFWIRGNSPGGIISSPQSKARSGEVTAQASLSNPAAFAASPAAVSVAPMVPMRPSAERSRMMADGTPWGGEKFLHNPVRTGIERTSWRISGLRLGKGKSAAIFAKSVQTFPMQTGRYHLKILTSRVNSPTILLPPALRGGWL